MANVLWITGWFGSPRSLLDYQAIIDMGIKEPLVFMACSPGLGRLSLALMNMEEEEEVPQLFDYSPSCGVVSLCPVNVIISEIITWPNT